MTISKMLHAASAAIAGDARAIVAQPFLLGMLLVAGFETAFSAFRLSLFRI